MKKFLIFLCILNTNIFSGEINQPGVYDMCEGEPEFHLAVNVLNDLKNSISKDLDDKLKGKIDNETLDAIKEDLLKDKEDLLKQIKANTLKLEILGMSVGNIEQYYKQDLEELRQSNKAIDEIKTLKKEINDLRITTLASLSKLLNEATISPKSKPNNQSCCLPFLRPNKKHN